MHLRARERRSLLNSLHTLGNAAKTCASVVQSSPGNIVFFHDAGDVRQPQALAHRGKVHFYNFSKTILFP